MIFAQLFMVVALCLTCLDGAQGQTLRGSTGSQPARTYSRFRAGGVLTFPPEVNGTGLVLNLDTLDLRDPAELELPPFYTRAFGAEGLGSSFPGPAIVANPGDVLKMRVHNRLRYPDPDCADGSSYCQLNTTNLHTHGLHVSPKKHSDNVFEPITPGNHTWLRIEIPSNHMGGTFWYHSHHHHSTASQAGGGALGALIIKDPADSLPPEIAQMPEVLLVVTYLNIPTSKQIEEEGQGSLWQTNASTTAALVNGLYMPSGSLVGGRWHRFRLVYAAIRKSLEVAWTGDAHCEMQLLAKDGVYLPQAPRKISTIYLPSGGRADVAVRCSCTEPPCAAELLTEPNIGGPNGPYSRNIDIDPDGTEHAGTTLSQSLASFTVSAGSDQDPDLKPFVLRRPCYLVNLLNTSVPAANNHSIQLVGPSRTNESQPFVGWDGNGTRFEHSHPLPPAVAKIPLPAVHEWRIEGTDYSTAGISAHPFHIHVSPYQIKELPNATIDYDNFFAVGDWHDTLLHSGGDWAVVRYQTEKFTGEYVMHCHILQHEDEGMMTWLEAEGEEGAVWKEAKEIDPTCYRDEEERSVGPNWRYI